MKAILKIMPGHREAMALNRPSPGEAILAEKYREATRMHLKHLPVLFRSLTGLRCHVLWSSSCSQCWNENDLPNHSPLCRCLTQSNPRSQIRCHDCARQHLAMALKSGHAGHQFTCFLGAHNFLRPVIVRHKTLGLAYIQTLSHHNTSSRLPQNPCGRTSDTGSATAVKLPGQACRCARRMSHPEFHQAALLLQLVLEHAEALTVSELRRADLEKTQKALGELQKVATHLRQDLNGLMSPLKRTAPDLQPLTHTERIVQNALDYIHQNYTRAITLAECANTLRLSTAYLSDLFSRGVGLPFKAYLTEIRLEKAQELLGTLDMNISQVAAAVGYASENRFRIAFKAATGLSPKAWRETLRMRSESSPPEPHEAASPASPRNKQIS